MQKTTHKNSIRLMILLIYYVFSSPMYIKTIQNVRNGNDRPFIFVSIFLIVFILYILLEFIEFYKWHYQYNDYIIPRILFFVRVFLLIVLFIVFPDRSRVRVFMLFSFSPPLIFYAYFIFPGALSFIFIIVIGISKILYDLFFNSFMVLSSQSIVMFLYTIVTDLLFYGLAWFLDRDQKQSEENQKLLDQLRDYASKVAHSVAMEERTRLARDIHDTLGHSLTAIQIQLSKAEAYMDKDLEEAGNAVRAAKMTAKDAMFDVRTSVSTLNSDDDIVDFKNRVNKILEGIKGTELHVEFEQIGADAGYNFSVVSTLLKIVQEGLTNILKHGKADSAEMSIVFGLTECHLTLRDNGCGFDLSKFKNKIGNSKGHYGLIGLEQRMELVRGTLSIESESGCGTIIKASIPKDPVQLIGDKL